MKLSVEEELRVAGEGSTFPSAVKLASSYDITVLARMVAHYRERTMIEESIAHRHIASDLRKSKELHHLHMKLYRMRRYIARLKEKLAEKEKVQA